MRLRMSRRTTVGLAATSVLALGITGFALSNPASAAPRTATAGVNEGGDKLSYTAAARQSNDLSVTLGRNAAGAPSFRLDDRVPITAGDGCEHPSSSDRTVVVCTLSELPNEEGKGVIRLGDRKDTVRFTKLVEDAGARANIYLGDGDDTFAGAKKGLSHAWVEGGNGNDRLTAYGELGPDPESLGGSTLHGDAGRDTIRIVGAGSGHGGRGNDEVIGTKGRQLLFGGPDNDVLRGGGGDDYLAGQTRNDRLYGEQGNDELLGNAGDDRLFGGPGTDRLTGGSGQNVLVQD